VLSFSKFSIALQRFHYFKFSDEPGVSQGFQIGPKPGVLEQRREKR
jgi:hypothetical protein